MLHSKYFNEKKVRPLDGTLLEKFNSWRHNFLKVLPPRLFWSSRARHFVPMGAHLVYISRVTRPNGRPWAQNVGLYFGGNVLWTSASSVKAGGWTLDIYAFSLVQTLLLSKFGCGMNQPLIKCSNFTNKSSSTCCSHIIEHK